MTSRTAIHAAVFTLFASTAILSPASAEDCNVLIEDEVAYLQAPTAPNECRMAYHVVYAVVSIANVTTIQTQSPEPGQPPISTDIPIVTVAIPAAVPDQLLQIGMKPRTPVEISAGVPPQPIRPYVLQTTGGIPRYYSDSGPVFSKSDTMNLAIREGSANAPATVTVEFAPLNLLTSISSLRRVRANATCVGPFLKGFYDDRTAFTIALSKSRGGEC